MAYKQYDSIFLFVLSIYNLSALAVIAISTVSLPNSDARKHLNDAQKYLNHFTQI